VTDAEIRKGIDGVAGKVGAGHPETSRRAATARPGLDTQRYRVLEVLAARGPGTAKEVASVLGIAPNQIATRLLELREGGYVAYLLDDQGTIVERPTGPRDSGLVQAITALGVAVL